ncbi:prepilin-type N-terminal cleavage/methylation domain-containing protein [Pseudenhygromyxa sp. WMMC2535]|uniref:pilus assembly FimT family protein n=1 Tax=Pseudenhygromyxa sp. WMMC2535 TaxID=2712867 RepID=UPI001551DBFF|nr:prepilin-type N-terminal cleavage/methylation domain-containing protein [Pseudenhygromyxa sp. WMMC2535]NVB36715.1 prepilin-type N-terminal cleavage/methylation domain-containing protein [Pseudenhygromyxa sp. WMMC2535]
MLGLAIVNARARCRGGRPAGGCARARAGQRGLTLIEILVVLFIIVLIMWSATVTMGAANQAEIVRSTNQLASTIRFTYDRARFTSAHYRIHVNFEERSFQIQRADEAMYLPATDRNGELFVPEADQLEDQAERDERAADAYYSSVASAYMQAGQESDTLDPYAVQQKQVPRARKPLFESFEPDGTLGELGEPIVFPEGVEIISVHTDAYVEPVTEGEADLYFFPRGQTQLAHIQLRGEPKLRQRMSGEEALEYTIIVQPLTGKVTVEPGLIDLELPSLVGDEEDALGEKAEQRSF